MRTKMFALLLAVTSPALAHDGEMGAPLFHMFMLELDGNRHRGNLELDGWIGGDERKLWIKAEGALERGKIEEGNVAALASFNVSEFWDVQVGVEQSFEPGRTTALMAGLNGLAPYFFETELHALVRSDGRIEARGHFAREFLFTNRLIMEPYAEVHALSRSANKEGRGAGLTDITLGTQLRYEIRRDFAPYVKLEWETLAGGTARRAQAKGEDSDTLALTFGLRLVF